MKSHSSVQSFLSGRAPSFDRLLIARLFLLVVGVALAIAFSHNEGFVVADLLTTLITGAGVNTPSGNQSQCESDILVGDVDTTNPLRGLKVNIGGETTIDIQVVALVDFYQKVSNRICGSVIGLVMRIATGRIYNKTVNITFTNDAATVPNIYWNSQNSNGRPIYAKQDGIIANSSKEISGLDFAFLAVTPSANVGSFDLTFKDNTQQRYTVVEADALFAKTNDTEANGRLNSVVTGFDNMRGNIKSVKINATTAVTYMTVL